MKMELWSSWPWWGAHGGAVDIAKEEDGAWAAPMDRDGVDCFRRCARMRWTWWQDEFESGGAMRANWSFELRWWWWWRTGEKEGADWFKYLKVWASDFWSASSSLRRGQRSWCMSTRERVVESGTMNSKQEVAALMSRGEHRGIGQWNIEACFHVLGQTTAFPLD
jgi:hypothetical protein